MGGEVRMNWRRRGRDNHNQNILHGENLFLIKVNIFYAYNIYIYTYISFIYVSKKMICFGFLF